ncbi:BMP family lipoprotein [Halanaerobacter jeridensis]|uniref:Basic membrane protein A n=1 Tax=Halanaerobacter jeridensis TaxID=706427 RepID=A0A938XUA2_9FIRM|nr:BMP family ABC transporter substrate-binding protein [Halanaerobacter jeridensis]MBM7557896.1 basic membrane protein A [Halanaerobacter jeridensis]
MRKKSLLVVTVLLVMALVAGCSGGQEATNEQSSEQAQQQEEELKVGIVLSSGGKGDKSFNDSALRGLSRAEEEGLISNYKYLEPKQVSVVEKNLRFLAENGYDLVIGVGFMQKDALTKVSKEFPDTNFAIVDEVVENDNVASITFKEHHGSFLTGAFAALMTNRDEIEGINEQQVVGFLGGMDMPLIHKFELGYTSGVEYINKTEGTNVKAKVAYAGSSPDAFNDPAKGKEIALAQYNAGADIIYHASGGTGGGLFNAAQKENHFAIGVDSDQDYIAPGFILTTMQKRVDNAVYDVVQSLKNDNFTAGVKEYGLEKEGIKVSLSGLAPMTKAALESGDITEEQADKIREMKEMIPSEIKDKIKKIRDKIIAGEIDVPNYLEQNN